MRSAGRCPHAGLSLSMCSTTMFPSAEAFPATFVRQISTQSADTSIGTQLLRQCKSILHGTLTCQSVTVDAIAASCIAVKFAVHSVTAWFTALAHCASDLARHSLSMDSNSWCSLVLHCSVLSRIAVVCACSSCDVTSTVTAAVVSAMACATAEARAASWTAASWACAAVTAAASRASHC